MADEIIPPQIRNGGAGAAPVATNAPDYRQVQSPDQIDIRHVDMAANEMGSAAAGRARELGNLFKEFEGQSSRFGESFALQSGKRAGAAAGAAGRGQEITGLASVTPYAEGYNAAVHQTYITQSQLALEQQLTDIESNSLGDPEGFTRQAMAAVQGAIKGMDPVYQPGMSLWAQARVQAGVNRQNTQKAEDARNTALATYQSATPDLITSALHTAAALPGEQGDAVIQKLISDDQDRLDALVKSRTITPEQAVRLHQKMIDSAHQQMSGQKVDISLQPILQTMRTNVEAADRLIVRDDPNLTPDENAARQAEFEKERRAYVETQTRAHVGELTAVHQQLVGGDYGPAIEGHLHSLYKAGALSEEGLFGAMAQSLRNQLGAIDHDASLKLIDDVVHGERQGPLDPKNKEQAKAVDEYFQEHLAQAGTVSDQQYAIGAAEIFRQTGILPASVQSRIRVGLMSGDPLRAATAAALADKIQKVNPEADAFVANPKLTALSNLINDNLKTGMTAQAAYEMAVRTTDVPESVRKIRDANYRKALSTGGGNEKALQDTLDAATPGFFSHAPAAPNALKAEFNSLTHEFYDQTGDIGKARDLAAKQLRQHWGMSSINGAPELMKYPIPDALVPAVRADLAAAAKDTGYAGDPKTLRLTPNGDTDASGGRVWGVTHTDPNTGLEDVLLDKNNRPVRYALPAAPDFKKAREALVEKKLADARAERDAQRQNSADQVKFEQQLADQYLRPRVGGLQAGQ